MTRQIPNPTLVKNQLIHPDGTARRGEKVDFIVRAYTDWRHDEEGRVVGTTSTWTNVSGVWRACLLPWEAYEAGNNTIVEVREGGVTTGYIQVPETEVEQWMRNLLVEPPTPSGWHPIARLGDLHDVDRQSVDGAPNGAMLVKRDGKWVAEMPTFGKERLSELNDVDESVSWANYNDALVYLSNSQGWGVTTPKPSSIHATTFYDDADPQRLWVNITEFNQNKKLAIYWGDNTADTSVPSPEVYGHTFADPGTYAVAVYYLDGSEDPKDFPTVIPNPGT